MHPAPSIIAFTTFSGLGLGLLFWLGVDPEAPTGWIGFAFFLIGYLLAGGGLMASGISPLGGSISRPKASMRGAASKSICV